MFDVVAKVKNEWQLVCSGFNNLDLAIYYCKDVCKTWRKCDMKVVRQLDKRVVYGCFYNKSEKVDWKKEGF